jgi:hypothetical protein
VSVQQWQSSFLTAAAEVADRVLDAVRGTNEVGLAEYVSAGTDPKVALGAVRLVGADLFAPHALLGRPVHPDYAAVVVDSLAVFPTVAPATTRQHQITAWRDWATRQLLARATTPVPAALDVTPPAGESVTALFGTPRDWRGWATSAAQLSPLALPGVGGPILEAVFDGARPLAQGTTRAVLRRDFVTAARLVRWIALLVSAGVRQPLDPVLLVERIRLYGGTGSRLALDLAIARHLLGLEPA